MNTCTFEDCNKPVRSVRLCRGHYRQRLDGEDLRPLQKHIRGASLREKLEARTDKSEACWYWTGARSSGYGEVTYNGKAYYAHRAWYETLVGPIPAGRVLDHTCYTRHCVNPDHLQPVTAKQNNENRSGLSRNNTSGARGVSWDARSGKWSVNVMHNRRRYFGGYHDSLEDARHAATTLRNRLFSNNLGDRRAS